MAFDGDVRRAATVITARDEATDDLRRIRKQSNLVTAQIAKNVYQTRRLIAAFAALGVVGPSLAATMAGVAATQAEAGQRFQNLQTILGATNEEIEQLRATAQQLSDEMAVSVQSVSLALEQLALSGYTASESMRVVDEVSQLMASSSLEAEEAATQLADVFESYSVAADEASQVTGAFAAVVEESQTNVGNLTKSLNNAADAAERTGVSLNETAAAAGILADAGIQGEEAGTALASTFESLQSPSEETRSALNQLGVEMSQLRDEEGNLRNLNQVSAVLADGFSNVENESARARLAIQLVGEDGADALLSLVENQQTLNEQMGAIFRSEVGASLEDLSDLNDEAIRSKNNLGEIRLSQDISAGELAQQLRNLAEQGRSTSDIAASLSLQLGVSEEAAMSLAEAATDTSVSVDDMAASIRGAASAAELQAEQTDTLVGAVNELVGTFSTIANRIYQGLRAPLMGVIDTLNNFFEGIAANEQALEAFGRALVPLTGAVLALFFALAAVLTKLLIIYPIVSLLQPVFADLSLTMLTLRQGVVLVAGAFHTFFKVLTRILIPVYAFIETANMMGTVIEDNILGAGSDFRELMSGLGNLFGAIKPLIDATIEGFVIFFDILVKLIALPIVGLLIGLMKVLNPIVNLLELVAAGLNAIIPFGNNLVDVLGFLIAAFITIKTVGAPIVAFFGTLTTVVGYVVSGIATLVGLLNPISATVLAIIGLITAIVALIGHFGGLQETVDAVIGFLGGLVNALQTVVGRVVDIAASIANALVSAIVDGIRAYISLVLGIGRMIIGALVDGITAYIGFVNNVGDRIVSAIANGLLGGVSVVVEAIKTVVSAIASFLPFSNAERGPLSNVMSSGSAIIAALVGGLTDGVGAAVDATAGIAEGVTDTIGGLVNTAKTLGGQVAGAIADGIAGSVDVVTSAVSGLVGAVKDTISDGAGMVAGAASSIGDAVANGVRSAKDAVSGAASDIAAAIDGALPGSDAEFGPLSNLTQAGPNLVHTIASGIRSNEGTLMSAATETLGRVMEPLKNNPAAQAATTLVSEVAEGVQNATDAIGIDVPGLDAISRAGQSFGSDGGDQQSLDTGSQGQGDGGSDGITININQTITVDSDGDATTSDVEAAAESGTSQAVQDAIAELERLLQQEMYG